MGEGVSTAEALRDIALTVAAIVGFPIVIQRARSHDKQATAAREQAEANRKQAETDSRRRLAEAYAQAADLFAKTALPLRLAGLYALWKIAEEDAENHHVQIMRILCAFVRNPTPLDGWESGDDKYLPERLDIEAILDLISRRRKKEQIACEQESRYFMDFRKADLRRANFCEADFSGAKLEFADLRDAFCAGAKFDINTDFKDAAMNGVSFDGVEGEVDAISEGVILTKNGKILPPGEPSCDIAEYIAQMSREDIQEWQERRRKEHTVILP